jgi:hypothetical protein
MLQAQNYDSLQICINFNVFILWAWPKEDTICVEIKRPLSDWSNTRYRPDYIITINIIIKIIMIISIIFILEQELNLLL